MSNPQPTDLLLVNRNNTSYSLQQQNLMADLQDSDLLLVNRSNVSYKITGAELKDSLGPSEIDPVPGDVTAIPDFEGGDGSAGDPFVITPATSANVGGTILSLQQIIITAGNEGDTVVWTDNSPAASGVRFNQPLGIIDAAGQWANHLVYLDNPDSTVTTDYVGLLQIGSVHFTWTVTQEVITPTAPIINTLTIGNRTPGTSRFTSETFPIVFDMTEQGEPVAGKGLKAKVEGQLSVIGETDPIDRVEGSWNQSAAWSSTLTTSTTTFRSGNPASSAFDGDANTWAYTETEGATITWIPPQPIAYTSLEVSCMSTVGTISVGDASVIPQAETYVTVPGPGVIDANTPLICNTVGESQFATLGRVKINGMLYVDPWNQSQTWSDAPQSGVVSGYTDTFNASLEGGATTGTSNEATITATSWGFSDCTIGLYIYQNGEVNINGGANITDGSDRLDWCYTTISGALNTIRIMPPAGQDYTLRAITIDGNWLVNLGVPGEPTDPAELIFTGNKDLANGLFLVGDAVIASNSVGADPGGTVQFVDAANNAMLVGSLTGTFSAGTTIINTVSNPLVEIPITDEIVASQREVWASMCTGDTDNTGYEPANIFEPNRPDTFCYPNPSALGLATITFTPDPAFTGAKTCKIYYNTGGGGTPITKLNGVDVTASFPSVDLPGSEVTIVDLQSIGDGGFRSFEWAYDESSGEYMGISQITIDGTVLEDSNQTRLDFSTDKDLANFIPGLALTQELPVTPVTSPIVAIGDGNTYSQYGTGTPFDSSYEWDQAFMGISDPSAHNAFAATSSSMTWTPPAPIAVNTEVKFYVYNQTDLTPTGLWVNDDTVSFPYTNNYGVEVSATAAQLGGQLKNVKLYTNDENLGAYLSGIEVDGVLLLDNSPLLTFETDQQLNNFLPGDELVVPNGVTVLDVNPTDKQMTVDGLVDLWLWSEYVTGDIEPGQPATYVFDSDLENICYGNFTGGQVTFALPAGSVMVRKRSAGFAVNSLKVKPYQLSPTGNNASFLINDIDFSSQIGDGEGTPGNPARGTWIEIQGFPTPITSIKWGSNSATDCIGMQAIEINGVVLQDGTNFGAVVGPVLDGRGTCLNSMPESKSMLIEETARFAVGSKVVGAAAPVQSVELWATLDNNGNVSDLESEDPGYTTMATTADNQQIVWPATLPSGQAPDTDLPAGTKLTVYGRASNATGTSSNSDSQVPS